MILKLFPEAGIPRKVPEGVPDPSPRTIIRSPATRTSLISHFRSGKIAPRLLNPPMTFSRGKQASLPPHDIQSDEVFLGKAAPKHRASDHVTDRFDLGPGAEHALCIGDGRAQHKESVTNRLLADRVEIWGFVLAKTLLLDRDSVLQGVDLLHVFLVFWIGQNPDY